MWQAGCAEGLLVSAIGTFDHGVQQNYKHHTCIQKISTDTCFKHFSSNDEQFHKLTNNNISTSQLGFESRYFQKHNTQVRN